MKNLITAVAFTFVSSSFALECDKAGLEQLQGHLEAIESYDSTIVKKSTFNFMYRIAEGMASSFRCRKIALTCSPESANNKAYKYVGDTWDWNFSGPITAFTLQGSKTSTSHTEMYLGTRHDGLAREHNVPMTKTITNTSYRLSVTDGDEADAMMDCFQAESAKLPLPKPLSQEEISELNELSRRGPY